jgi:hypothetical protein
VRVKVAVWPDELSRNLPPTKVESAERLAERRDAHSREVVEKRVRIVLTDPWVAAVA